jgi:hypothetical protein
VAVFRELLALLASITIKLSGNTTAAVKINTSIIFDPQFDYYCAFNRTHNINQIIE